MTYKEFSEDAIIEYILIVKANDYVAIELTAPTEEMLLEKLNRVDLAISNTLSTQFEDLDESGVEND